MSEQNIDTPDTFDADYVKGLRQEAAKYRNQSKELKTELEGYRGLEAQIHAIRIENEFIRRGVTAEPQWVQYQDGENPSQAVDRFLEKYPQFGPGSIQAPEDTPKAGPQEYPQAMPPKSTTNFNPSTLQRSLDEIKQDPVARSNLTDVYREMLKNQSHQKD